MPPRLSSARNDLDGGTLEETSAASLPPAVDAVLDAPLVDVEEDGLGVGSIACLAGPNNDTKSCERMLRGAVGK